MKKITYGLVLILLILVPASFVSSHCEIPCGIYDDKMRIKLLLEHVATVEKSMTKIDELQTKGLANSNQLVRWVMNKENHAGEIQEIVTQYFLTQRIKKDKKNYHEQLALLHQILVAAMKSKQTIDFAHTDELKRLIGEFDAMYFAPH